MRADDAADVADVRQQTQVVAHLLAAAAHLLERGDVRQRREHMLDLLVDRGGEKAERLGARLLRREVRVAWIGGERVVQQRRHLAEPARVLRQPVGLAPLERVEREVPAVALGGDELLQDRERRLERPALVGDVALERGRMLEAALGEEAQHLELRVHPRLEPAVELEREPLVEDERAVRLLGSHRPHLLDVLRQVARRAEDDRRLARLERRVGPDQLVHPPRELRVGDRVVRDPALGLGDHRLGPPVTGGPEAEREVVELVRLQPVAHLDDRDREDRRLAGRDAGVEHARVEDVLRLAAEPALRRDRAEQDEPVEEAQVTALDPALQITGHRQDPGAGTRRSRAARA